MGDTGSTDGALTRMDDAGSTDGASAEADEPFSTCLVGWWLTGPAPCSAASGFAESKASDCQSFSFTGYRANKTATEGVYEYSPSLGTMSGLFGTTTYILRGTALQILPGSHVFQGSCTSSQLALDGQLVTRAPQNIANTLVIATANDGAACPVSTCSAMFALVPVR